MLKSICQALNPKLLGYKTKLTAAPIRLYGNIWTSYVYKLTFTLHCQNKHEMMIYILEGCSLTTINYSLAFGQHQNGLALFKLVNWFKKVSEQQLTTIRNILNICEQLLDAKNHSLIRAMLTPLSFGHSL